MKLCAKCGCLKAAGDFNRNKWKKDGLQHYCRDCHRRSVVQSQRTHRDAFLRRQRRYNDRKRNEIRRNIFDYLRAHPCVDCGESDVLVLDFDHRRDKEHAISQLVCSNKSWGEILREIEKCEIRCANCHRRKTARQFGWKKFYWQLDSLKRGHTGG
jgi:hypothetical protein